MLDGILDAKWKPGIEPTHLVAFPARTKAAFILFLV